jgi:hypothetical protein
LLSIYAPTLAILILIVGTMTARSIGATQNRVVCLDLSEKYDEKQFRKRMAANQSLKWKLSFTTHRPLRGHWRILPDLNSSPAKTMQTGAKRKSITKPL